MLVVIADKDPHDLQALKAAFESPTCEVEAGYDGRVALATTRERSPDAVVVASSLGSMGGFAVSREIKTSADLGEIREPKVIVLLERQADTWLAGWSRCDAHMVKPVDPVEVFELVRSLLPEQTATA